MMIQLMYSKLSILPTPNITNISILRTEKHFSLVYSNENLANPLCITTFRLASSRFCEPYFFSREPKIPRQNELKAPNTAENNEKKYFVS